MPSFTVFKGSKSGAPTKSTTKKPDQLEGDMVQLKVTVSGLCGTGEYPSDALITSICRSRAA